MADATSIKPIVKMTKREEILKANEDKDNWEWVEIPATDLFDQIHCGVSINFQFFQPEKNEDGNYTGNPGKYHVSPEMAGEIRKLLKNKMNSDIRLLQPKRDQVAIDIMNRNGARIGGSVL